MSKQLKICMVGGAGFVGHHIAADLAEMGHRITIPTRHRQRHRDMLVWQTVGLSEGDVYDAEFLTRQFRGMDVVINLVGILNEKGHSGKGFERSHVELIASISQAIQATGVPRFLHMSALNASANAPSHYLVTKARGEDLAHEIPDCDVTSFRPSVIFGAGDSFTNRFACLLESIPWLFPLAKPDARFQPIHVGDVSQCFVRSINQHSAFGRRYDLGGPNVYTLCEIVEFVNQLMELDRHIIRLSDWQARMQATFMEWIPGKPFSVDNLRSLEVDSICNPPCPLPFDIEPKSMETVVPDYLRPGGGTLNRIRYATPPDFKPLNSTD